ncbi:MAG: hypothetical protein AABW79_04360 [Nanoarchaeota archaeon]
MREVIDSPDNPFHISRCNFSSFPAKELDKNWFRPAESMKNPFIGKDGRDYHSYEDLLDANKQYYASKK